MKTYLTYWLIGCLIVGAQLGHDINRCKQQQMSDFDILTSVAVWPAAFVMSIIASVKIEPPECK